MDACFEPIINAKTPEERETLTSELVNALVQTSANFAGISPPEPRKEYDFCEGCGNPKTSERIFIGNLCLRCHEMKKKKPLPDLNSTMFRGGQ